MMYNFLMVSFWSTWWFKIGIIVVLASIAFIFHRRRVNLLKDQKALTMQRFEECNELLSYSKENELKAKEEAELSNRSRNLVLAKLSHEIRTPMNGVIGMTSLLLETPLSLEQREYSETISNSAEKLMTVINDILITDVMDYSHIASSNIEPEHKDFDLRNTIEEVLEMFAGKAAQTGLELVYRMDENVPTQIVGDIDRLRQVLMNLVENAIRFTTKGEIFIGVHLLNTLEGNQIDLGFEVRDTGGGMPAEEIELLSKDISSINIKKEGNGLGLAICKKLVSLMGGNLEVETKEGAGAGTLLKFKIRLRASLQPLRSNVYFDPALEGKKY